MTCHRLAPAPQNFRGSYLIGQDVVAALRGELAAAGVEAEVPAVMNDTVATLVGAGLARAAPGAVTAFSSSLLVGERTLPAGCGWQGLLREGLLQAGARGLRQVEMGQARVANLLRQPIGGPQQPSCPVGRRSAQPPPLPAWAAGGAAVQRARHAAGHHPGHRWGGPALWAARAIGLAGLLGA